MNFSAFGGWVSVKNLFFPHSSLRFECWRVVMKIKMRAVLYVALFPCTGCLLGVGSFRGQLIKIFWGLVKKTKEIHFLAPVLFKNTKYRKYW